MQIILEPTDIQAMADVVVRNLKPMLSEILNAIKHTNLPQEPIPVIYNAQVKAEIIKRSEIILMTGLSSTTLWRLEKEGRFPARIPLSVNRVGWRRSEIEAWLASKRAVKYSGCSSR